MSWGSWFWTRGCWCFRWVCIFPTPSCWTWSGTSALPASSFRWSPPPCWGCWAARSIAVCSPSPSVPFRLLWLPSLPVVVPFVPSIRCTCANSALTLWQYPATTGLAWEFVLISGWVVLCSTWFILASARSCFGWSRWIPGWDLCGRFGWIHLRPILVGWLCAVCCVALPPWLRSLCRTRTWGVGLQSPGFWVALRCAGSALAVEFYLSAVGFTGCWSVFMLAAGLLVVWTGILRCLL